VPKAKSKNSISPAGGVTAIEALHKPYAKALAKRSRPMLPN
jgi:hypothetical protein